MGEGGRGGIKKKAKIWPKKAAQEAGVGEVERMWVSHPFRRRRRQQLLLE